jgi:hypothetical protein
MDVQTRTPRGVQLFPLRPVRAVLFVAAMLVLAFPIRAQFVAPSQPQTTQAVQLPLSGRTSQSNGTVKATESPIAGVTNSVNTLNSTIQVEGVYAGSTPSTAQLPFSGALGFRPQGVREHYLQFDFGTTWEIAEKSGHVYDTTVGNRKNLGFRVGLCSPFHPPDKAWEPMRILELPLTLMDTTLWGYLGMDEGQGLMAAKGMLDRVSDVGGLFVLLWHQEAVRMKGGRQFGPLLDAILAKGCHVATAVGVARWWEAREVPLIVDGGTYRFLGNPPAGLRLELEIKEGLKPKVTGGSVEMKGGRVFAEAASADFKLEIV